MDNTSVNSTISVDADACRYLLRAAWGVLTWKTEKDHAETRVGRGSSAAGDGLRLEGHLVLRPTLHVSRTRIVKPMVWGTRFVGILPARLIAAP